MSYNESRRASSNYPLMSDSEWRNAPWSEHEPEEKEFEITVSQTLSKTVTVLSSNYVEECEEEYDDEGRKAKFYDIDTTNINWEQEYADNDLHTPIQLIELFKKYLENKLDSKVVVSESPSYIKRLIKECEDWVEDETEFVE